jgi:hypothetical protein
MSDLAQLQREFAEHLRTGTETVAERIAATERVDVATRLGIYAEAYRLRLLEALTTDYPALREALSMEAFVTLANAYITAHPSTYYSLRYFGGHMSQFLRETADYADRPWLAELAEFEWTLSAVFDAADASPYTLEQASVLSPAFWPSMRLCLHPTVRRLNCRWNVAAFWQAVPDWQESESAVPWLLWRKDLRVYFRSLDEIECRALDLSLAGADFSALCVALSELLPETEVPLRVAGLFRAWIVEALLSDVEIGSSTTEAHGPDPAG